MYETQEKIDLSSSVGSGNSNLIIMSPWKSRAKWVIFAHQISVTISENKRSIDRARIRETFVVREGYTRSGGDGNFIRPVHAALRRETATPKEARDERQGPCRAASGSRVRRRKLTEHLTPSTRGAPGTVEWKGTGVEAERSIRNTCRRATCPGHGCTTRDQRKFPGRTLSSHACPELYDRLTIEEQHKAHRRTTRVPSSSAAVR